MHWVDDAPKTCIDCDEKCGGKSVLHFVSVCLIFFRRPLLAKFGLSNREPRVPSESLQMSISLLSSVRHCAVIVSPPRQRFRDMLPPRVSGWMQRPDGEGLLPMQEQTHRAFRRVRPEMSRFRVTKLSTKGRPKIKH